MPNRRYSFSARLPLFSSSSASSSASSSSEAFQLPSRDGMDRYSDGSSYRIRHFLAGQRRRLLPLIALSVLCLIFLASSASSEDSVAANGLSFSSIPSRFAGIKGIFVRPSRYTSSTVTSDITAQDDDRRRQWRSPTPALPLEATLRERLQDLWDAPLDEPANWVKWNSQTCSRERVKQAQNDWITQDAALVWHSLNSTDIRRYRKGMIDYLVECEKNGLMDPAKAGSGRGLVFTAGNADTFSRVLLSLKMLKKYYHTSLPSEIFSFPGEVPPPELLAEFAEYNATLRYIEGASRDTTKVKNYQIKSDAIVASSFAEVLYLDSDNMPCAYLGEADGSFNPEYIKEHELIWNAPAYKRLGAMFWPDYWKTGPVNPIWAIIGTQCRDEWEQEAGQILIDKRKHMDTLLLANWMLDDWEFWFRLSDGDKDIFRFAFLALRKRWAVPGRYVGAAALPANTPSGFCGHTMLQHDHLGFPLFVHANLLKQIPSGIGKGFTWGRTRQTGLFNGGDPLVEGGEGSGNVEADMLANAGSDGRAIIPAVAGVRYRAALERGVYTRFHGGVHSALCVDIHYEDPRTKQEKADDLAYQVAHPLKIPELSSSAPEEDKGMVTHGTTGEGEVVDIDWRISPVIVGWWRDEPRLVDFENRFYDEGGKPSASGFT